MGTLRNQLHKQFSSDKSMMLLGEGETENEYEIISSRELTDEEKEVLNNSKNVKSYKQQKF
jgi:hypothetical protein